MLELGSLHLEYKVVYLEFFLINLQKRREK